MKHLPPYSRLQYAVLAATFAFTLVAFGNQVEAQKSAKAEVLIVLAKEKGKEIDAELKKMSALSRPPFNAFGEMKIIDRPKFTLKVGQDQDVKLPNGRTLRIQVQRVMPNGSYRVRVAINKEKKKDYLPLLQVVASPGDPFFVAGQRHDGGTLVVGIKIAK